MGYIEETGAAQHLRDARITTIYEGTTGIQANDLIGRKMMRDRGAAALILLGEVREIERALAARDEPELVALHAAIARAAKTMEQAGRWLLERGAANPVAAGAAAVNLVHIFGLTIGGALLARSALRAADLLAAGEGNRIFLQEKMAVARFFAGQILPEAWGRLEAVLDAEHSALQLYPYA